MLRIPHIRKHTPQPSRQTKRGVHKRTSPCQQRHTSKAPTAPHRHNVQPGTTAAYRHKSIPFRPPQSSTLKKARGVCRGAAALRPLCGFPFSSKKYCTPFAKKANATQYLKKSIPNLLLLYLTTRTLYIPSISLSSSNALADAALSRSIRV